MLSFVLVADRALHPPQHHGDAGVRRAQGEAQRSAQCLSPTMIAEYPKEIVAGMGARYIDGVFFNIFAVYSIAYLISSSRCRAPKRCSA